MWTCTPAFRKWHTNWFASRGVDFDYPVRDHTGGYYSERASREGARTGLRNKRFLYRFNRENGPGDFPN